MPRIIPLSFTALAVAVLLAVPFSARAHCDTLDGPVVASARRALDTGELAPVLAWVKPAGEQEVRSAFQRALATRDARSRTNDAADRQFFESLVRVHREGEGAPYTGLKPAGAGVGAALQAADRAVETGDPSDVERRLVASVRAGLHSKFEAVKALPPPADDVAAGRAWVAAYVEYVHHVERVDAVARGAGAHHGAGGEGEGAPNTAPHAHAD